MEVTTSSRSTVMGVSFDAGYPELVMANGQKISLGQVLGVHLVDESSQTPGAASAVSTIHPGDISENVPASTMALAQMAGPSFKAISTEMGDLPSSE